MKRGVLVIILMVLLSFTVSAINLNLTLDKTEFGPNEPLQGSVEFALDSPLEKTSQLQISIGNVVSDSKTINEMFTDIPNKQIVPAGFNLVSANQRDAFITYLTNGTKHIQIDLGLGGACQKNILESIDSFEMTLNGVQYNNKFPRSIKVDVGLDGEIEYTFKGNPINNYIPLNSSYINPQGPVIKKEANLGDVYCQEVILEPSAQYKIIATLQKNNPTTKIVASIVDDPSYTSFDFRGCLNPITEENKPVAKCCELQATNTMRDVSCLLPKEVNDKQKQYICVLAQGDENIGNNVFTINADTDPIVKKGYYNGEPSLTDAYIKAEYQDFEKEIKALKIIKSNPLDQEDPFVNAIDKAATKSLAIPVGISSYSEGKLEIKDLKVKINCQGTSIIESYNIVDLGGERINYTGNVKVQLTKFANLKAPLLIGSNYSITASIENASVSKQITITAVPIGIISASKYTAKAGEDVVFSGADSRSLDGSPISVYEWDFGDSSVKKTGKFISYKYTFPGNYTVSLKVTDNKGKSGVGTAIINIEEENVDELPARIDEKLQLITQAKQKIETDESVKEVSEILNIKAKLEEAFANLSVTKTQISAELQKENRSLTEINKLKLNFESKSNEIPIEISSSSTTFDGKVKDLADIPDANDIMVETVDKFKERLLTYQLQDSIKVDGKMFNVRVKYLSNKVEDLMLIEKTITGGGTVFEIIPSDVKVKEILTPNSQNVKDNVIKWTGVNKILYLIDGTDVLTATKIKTIIMPLSLEEVKLSNEGKKEFQDIFACGDNVCKVGVEDELSCPQDCKKKIPWIPIGILVLVLILGVFYFNFYHGPGSIEQLFKKKPQITDYFKDPKAYSALLTFSKNSLTKGINESQIRLMLAKKKWSKAQIDFVLENARRK